MRINRTYTVVFLAVFTVAFLFGVYTDLRWDDWWITFRASKNLPWGDGLTFTNGEPPIHSFTSPLGALLPAALSAVAGRANDELVIWLFRIVCSLFLGGAAVLLVKFAERIGTSRLFSLLLVAVVFLDAKTLANTINGMETAILLFFLTLALIGLTLQRGRQSIVVQGLAWSGLMWTRPDGFIWVIALTLAFLIFRPRPAAQGGRSGQLKEWITAGAIVVVLYTPWLLWAWHYYGSPIPNTILAKGMHQSGGDLLGRLRHFAFHFVTGRTETWKAILMPPYAIAFGGWPPLLVKALQALSLGAALIWLVPWARPATRALSFAALIGHFYLFFGMEYAFPWYYPPATLLSLVAVMLVLDQVRSSLNPESALRHAPIIVGGATICLVALVTLAAAVQLRFFQEVIYDRNYKLVGLWLHDHAASAKDTVLLEPLGYIGYYSGLKMYDYPGLSSREVMNARKRFPMTDIGDRAIFAKLIPYLKPDWLVLRPLEVTLIQKIDPQLLTRQYSIVKTFDVSQQVMAAKLPGENWLQLDQTFVVYRRGK